MVRQCNICKKVASFMEYRGLHSLPKDDHLRQEWINALGIGHRKISKYFYVCSDHFDEKSFAETPSDRNRTLRKDAIPLNQSSSEKLSNDSSKIVDKEQNSDISVVNLTDPQLLSMTDHKIGNVRNYLTHKPKILQPPRNLPKSVTTVIDYQRSNGQEEYLNQEEEKSQNKVLMDAGGAPLIKNDNSDSEEDLSNENQFEDERLLASDENDEKTENQKSSQAEKRQIRNSTRKRGGNSFFSKKLPRKLFVGDEAYKICYEAFEEFASIEQKKFKNLEKKLAQSQKKIASLEDVVKNLKKEKKQFLAEKI